MKTIAKIRILLLIIAIFCIVSSNIKAQGQGNGNSQGLWSAKGKDTVETSRNVNILKSVDIADILKIGNSIILSGFTQPGTTNDIFADNGDLLLQSDASVNFNTIINANNAGRVGIGTLSPVFSLTLAGDGINTNGGILSVGTFDPNPFPTTTLPDIPTGLTGPRFIWYPKRAAIRAGQANSTQWDEGNIGNHSAAFGLNTIASGPNSFAMGNSSVASATHSIALGNSAQATAFSAVAIGDGAQAMTPGDIAIGPGALANSIGPLFSEIAIGPGATATAPLATAFALGTASGQGSIAHGSGSEAMGEGSFVTGQANTSGVNARDAFVFGRRNVANAAYAFAGGGSSGFPFTTNSQALDSNSFAFGDRVISDGFAAFALGIQVNAQGRGSFAMGELVRAGAPNSFALGQFVQVDPAANSSMVFGSGLGIGSEIVNNTANSLIIGFNSDIATFFVGPAVGTPGSLGKIGMGTTAPPSSPADRVEINSNVADSSGLKFTQLNALSPAADSNSTNTVLSVDDNGTVILVEDTKGADEDWSGAGSGFMFAADVNDRVGIGVPISGLAKFRSFNSSENFAGRFETINSTATGFQWGVFGTVQGGVLSNFGVEGSASSSISSSFNTGVKGFATGSPNVNKGVEAIADLGDPSTTINYGVFANASGGFINYGIFANVQPNIAGSPNNVAGFFSGDIDHTGNINFVSDSILKENIQPIQNATGLISQIQGKTFNFDTANFPMNLPSGLQYGIIAQDMEQVLSELVSNSVFPAQYDSLGNQISPEIQYKSTNYIAFIPILIKAFNERGEIIDSLGHL